MCLKYLIKKHTKLPHAFPQDPGTCHKLRGYRVGTLQIPKPIPLPEQFIQDTPALFYLFIFWCFKVSSGG